MIRMSAEEQWRLLNHLLGFAERKGDCLECKGGVNSKGYKTISIRGKNYYAHRVMYALVHGKIEDRNQVHHSCDNRRCIEPNHLFQGTAKDNHTDMRVKGKAFAFGEWLPPEEYESWQGSEELVGAFAS
jgi:hypothetical protein